MATVPVSASAVNTRSRHRSVIIASSDSSFLHRLSDTLTGLRWQVREVGGGADVWALSQSAAPQSVIVDSWLPDLELDEFVDDFGRSFPQVDLIVAGEAHKAVTPRGPHHQELLYALRRCQDFDTAAWNCAPDLSMPKIDGACFQSAAGLTFSSQKRPTPTSVFQFSSDCNASNAHASATMRLPELIGNAPSMLELSRRIRLVAPRLTPVLIEGPTGSGKELVAQAVHRLSSRSRKPFVAINCAAIPEALIEAELFGHTRGAFTGAVQGRVGRIEAADGGTLFLDEIGELPLAVQSKLLRFVECGELQRVGDNECVKVDVRIVAATHRPLSKLAQDGDFRPDLYYRLAVFLIRTPALAEHKEDLPLLANHFLERLGKQAPMKQIAATSMAKLMAHDWPGNVRELEHVLERAAILAGDEPLLTASEIDFGTSVN